jgi:hypothetical protein
LSVEAVQERATEFEVTVVACKLAGIDGGVVSEGGVVTVEDAERGELLPAASVALTAKMYVVLGASPASTKRVDAVDDTSDPFKNT